MKKTLSTILLSTLTLSAAANTIVPETSRDGKTLNNSAIAVSTQQRKFAGAMIEDTEETSGLAAFGAYSYKNYSAEGVLDFGDGYNSINAKGGMKLSNDLAIGLGIDFNSFDSDAKDMAVELAASTKWNDFIVGGSVTYNSQDLVIVDGSFLSLTAGLGQVNKKMTWEAGMTYSLSSDDLGRDDTLNLFGGLTMIVDKVEYDADISVSSTDGLNIFSDNIISLTGDAEILVKDRYYVTPGVMWDIVDYDFEFDNLAVSGDFGYRKDKIDATVGVDFFLGGDLNLKVNAVYFF
ncbi:MULTISPECIES: hypothetical protein [unclassified Halobacteriovorax]|uniref:hypothetical protein n=1 Tax=unclassified Halobacteriovorax TaxID=2639665 RepID=UPI00399A4132